MLYKGPGDLETWSNRNGMKLNKGKKRKAEPCGWEPSAISSSVAYVRAQENVGI